MAPPDFAKSMVDVLARRARYQCSNPDCGVNTVGPNSDPEKATTLGEAAHIMGAKPSAMRYDASMSDVTRAAITNGIWLCRNCHGQVDRDAALYPAELLFAWRRNHEDRVLRELGTRGQVIRYEIERDHLRFLDGYPGIIHRIATDKPVGWEWRLTAELMRYLNRPEFKRLKNLESGQYFRHISRVPPEDFLGWMQDRTHIMSNLVGPFISLLDRLTASWGVPGEAGDLEEIHDTCLLIRDALKSIVDHEEILRFSNIPEEGEEIRALLINSLGRNAKGLSELPEKLDEIVTINGTDHGGTYENPIAIKWQYVFELPEYFTARMDEALERYETAMINH